MGIFVTVFFGLILVAWILGRSKTVPAKQIEQIQFPVYQKVFCDRTMGVIVGEEMHILDVEGSASRFAARLSMEERYDYCCQCSDCRHWKKTRRIEDVVRQGKEMGVKLIVLRHPNNETIEGVKTLEVSQYKGTLPIYFGGTKFN